MYNIPTTTGSYILWLHLTRKRRIRIGRLGEHLLLPGFYAYCGSAFGPGGLKARLAHHLRPSTNPRWHIDYLKNVSSVIDVWYALGPDNLEHQFASHLSALSEAINPIRKFGASDCKCLAHLVYFKNYPDPKIDILPLDCRKLLRVGQL